MSKTQKKQELLKLMLEFFKTKDVQNATEIKDKICDEVLKCPYTKSGQETVEMSMPQWREDINNYLKTMDSTDNFHKKQADLALQGIINLVDISELES